MHQMFDADPYKDPENEHKIVHVQGLKICSEFREQGLVDPTDDFLLRIFALSLLQMLPIFDERAKYVKLHIMSLNDKLRIVDKVIERRLELKPNMSYVQGEVIIS